MPRAGRVRDVLTEAVRKAAHDAVEAGLNEYLVTLRRSVPSDRPKTRKAIKRFLRKGATGGIAGLIFPKREQFPHDGTETQRIAVSAWDEAGRPVLRVITHTVERQLSRLPTTHLLIEKKG